MDSLHYHEMRRRLYFTAGICLLFTGCVFAAPTRYSVGVARMDVTPSYPVRLAGYAVRSTECTNVFQRIWAKAIVLGKDRERPKVLITVDNCGVPINVRNSVVAELRRLKKIDPSNVTICSTHTHSAPMLQGYLTNLFIGPLPPDQDARLKRYTDELTHSLIQVTLAALDDRKPGTMTFGKGTAGFAANRRIAGGPVDHDVPVLFIHGVDGSLRAVLASYACHCTTLTGEFNEICGDWAGFAQQQVELDHPSAVCLIAVGCGADSNPNPRPGKDLAAQHGKEVAAAIAQLARTKGRPITGKLECRTRDIRLPYDTLPTREKWEALTKESPYVAQHARINLDRLNRGEKLPTDLPYMVQTWNFGKSLAMVFLPGEVTVDYSLRLKREFDASRIWVNAYANDVPCYIPSERVLKEGGYEGGLAMIYYDRPTKFAPGVEDLIVGAVHKLVPKSFRAGDGKNPASIAGTSE